MSANAYICEKKKVIGGMKKKYFLLGGCYIYFLSYSSHIVLKPVATFEVRLHHSSPYGIWKCQHLLNSFLCDATAVLLLESIACQKHFVRSLEHPPILNQLKLLSLYFNSISRQASASPWFPSLGGTHDFLFLKHGTNIIACPPGQDNLLIVDELPSAGKSHPGHIL